MFGPFIAAALILFIIFAMPVAAREMNCTERRQSNGYSPKLDGLIAGGLLVPASLGAVAIVLTMS